MGLFRLFRKNPHAAAAQALYGSLVAQARRPVFYRSFGVADTADGRFDMIALHAFLVMRRLGAAEDRTASDLSQALFDAMFVDVDYNLREMGVSDIRIGSNVKAVARAFYGRIEAYDSGLKASEDDLLHAALARNLYRKTDPGEARIAAMAAYARAQAAFLEAQPLDEILSGRVSFAAPVAPEAAS